MELTDHEVEFYKWCASCRHFPTGSGEDPCNACLETPFSEYSKKPYNYVEASKCKNTSRTKRELI